MKKHLLLLGGSGQLGTEIRRCWTGWEIVAPTHDRVDIEDAAALEAQIEAASPSVLVNCAAFHNVDRCEETPERAFAVNAIAVGAMARLCRKRGVRFVTIGTDYVFDGTGATPYTEDDAPRPISAYGTSKYAGELLVGSLESDALVVRTCGVYGVRPSAGKGHTFVDRVIAGVRAGEPVRVVGDVVASPTFAGDLALALRSLVEQGARGLYHAANPGPVSWYDFACEAVRQAGLPPSGVERISSAQWKAGARRPAFSALANLGLSRLGIAMPPWQDAIAAYLALLRLSAPAQTP